MRLWVYSVACVPLTSVPDFAGSPQYCNGEQKPAETKATQYQMLVFGVDETGVTHAVQIRDYKPHVLLFPKRKDIVGAGAVHNLDIDDFPTRIQPFIHHVEVWDKARVMLSFTNSKPKPMILVYLTNEKYRLEIEKCLRNAKMLIGDCIRVKEVLHKQLRAEVQFLYSSGLRLQAWSTVSDIAVESQEDTAMFFGDGVRYISGTICKDEANLTTNPPTLRKLYVRAFAHSSTATKTNQFDPSEDIAADEVRYIAYIVADTEVRSQGVLDYTQYGFSEANLLHAFGLIVQQSNIQVIVYAADEHMKPNSLVYLHKRAKRYGNNLNLLHFSKIKTLEQPCEMKTCNNGASTYLLFTHAGVERIDMCAVLAKAMVKPNLDGFRLLDALRHPELVRDKTPFQKLLQLNYHDLHSLSSHDTIRTDLSLFVQLLYTIERDNDFVVSQQNISHICDLDITSVSERGQQSRVRNLFCRKLFDAKIVINSLKTKQPYIIVKKPNKESSFVDPPWLENPPVESLRAKEPPRHIFHAPLPDHLSGLLALPHNNTFEIDEREKENQYNSSKKDDESNNNNNNNNNNEVVVTQKNELRWWQNRQNDDFVKKQKKKVTKTAAASTKRYSGGLVLDAQVGFYTKDEEAADTWDFGSLYPSIMEGYLLCYMRVIYKRKWLDDPRLQIQYIPITETECVAFAQTYDGVPVETILPSIVHDIVGLRASVRKQQANFTKGSFQWCALEGRQLAAKVVQNSVYGFTGSDTSGMTCTALAASITNIGRWMNRNIRFIILFLGGWVYYGDTDSVMARFWIDPKFTTRDEIFAVIYEQGFRVQKFGTNLFPKPNKLEFEAVKTRWLLLGKKIYATIQLSPKPNGWQLPPDSEPAVKGMAAKKRDKCTHAQHIGMTLLHRLLYMDESTEQHAKWYEVELQRVYAQKPNSVETLSPFMITCALNSEYKKQKDVLALCLADMIAKESGARPRPGTRLAFVVANNRHPLHCHNCETPEHFLQAKHSLDFAYYLENQIFNCVKQILCLPVHEPLLHVLNSITQRFVCLWTNRFQRHREITSFFKPVGETLKKRSRAPTTTTNKSASLLVLKKIKK